MPSASSGIGCGHSGSQDPTPLRAAKYGFCFFDTTRWRAGSSPTGHYVSRPTGTNPGCGDSASRTTRVGLSPGWADIYPWDFSGQYIDVTGVPAGEYLLCVTGRPGEAIPPGEHDQRRGMGASPDRGCQGDHPGDEADLLLPGTRPPCARAVRRQNGYRRPGERGMAVRSTVRSTTAQAGVARSTASFLCRLPGQQSA